VVVDVLAPVNPFGIASYGDDVLEDDIISLCVNVVLAICEALEPFSNDMEEGSIGSEVGTLLYVPSQMGSLLLPMRRCVDALRLGAIHRAKDTRPRGTHPMAPDSVPHLVGAWPTR
jgi:hypothetical protein